MGAYLTYLIVRGLGFILARLPIGFALGFGRLIGILGYYLDRKHKSIAYSNLKIALAKTKKPSEIRRIVQKTFKNYGMNLVEIFRLPHIQRLGWEKFVKVEGREHVVEALKQNKGAILLAMHFGSWEISSLMGEMLGHSYKMLAKPQDKFSKLDELLNSYRQCSGSSVILRGRGTRDIIEGLRNNEIVGMVVDQGGKDGALVKFFDRLAAMSVGAIRIGLKLGTPICFSIIFREQGPQHRLIIHKPLTLVNTGDSEKDVMVNLENIVKVMEGYITQYPSEYMWFYKIWKYSKESATVILSDGKPGHLNQSRTIGRMIEIALLERGIQSSTEIVEVAFKNSLARYLCALFSFFCHPLFAQGRLRFLKWFLSKKSFLDIAKVKADFVVSCGSSVAGVNLLLSSDYRAKSVSILRPGIFGFNRFNLVVLPNHDKSPCRAYKNNVVFIEGAANLVTENYLKEQSNLLLQRFVHLKDRRKLKVGLLIGGESKVLSLGESQIKLVIGQIRDACEQIDADILVTTSRRTPQGIENFLQRELKNFPRTALLIIANRNNVPEALGGILGLSDVVVVSGDSISMVSEAASSGKNVIVFSAQRKKEFHTYRDKHEIFNEQLHARGHIVLSSEKSIGQTICAMAKNKIKTKMINNNDVLFEATRRVI